MPEKLFVGSSPRSITCDVAERVNLKGVKVEDLDEENLSKMSQS